MQINILKGVVVILLAIVVVVLAIAIVAEMHLFKFSFTDVCSCCGAWFCLWFATFGLAWFMTEISYPLCRELFSVLLPSLQCADLVYMTSI